MLIKILNNIVNIMILLVENFCITNLTLVEYRDILSKMIIILNKLEYNNKVYPIKLIILHRYILGIKSFEFLKYLGVLGMKTRVPMKHSIKLFRVNALKYLNKFIFISLPYKRTK